MKYFFFFKEPFVWLSNKQEKNKQDNKKMLSLPQSDGQSRLKCLAPWDIKGMVHPNDKKTLFLTYSYWCLAMHIVFVLIWCRWIKFLFPLELPQNFFNNVEFRQIWVSVWVDATRGKREFCELTQFNNSGSDSLGGVNQKISRCKEEA